MSPQQSQVADFLRATDGWIKSAEITEQTGVKAPRAIIGQLRDMGFDIRSHQAGQNSKGYLFAGEPEQRMVT